VIAWLVQFWNITVVNQETDSIYGPGWPSYLAIGLVNLRDAAFDSGTSVLLGDSHPFDKTEHWPVTKSWPLNVAQSWRDLARDFLLFVLRRRGYMRIEGAVERLLEVPVEQLLSGRDSKPR